MTCLFTCLCHRNALEGFAEPDGNLELPIMSLHNLIHSVLNGTGAFPHSAANDPVFVVHSSPFDFHKLLELNMTT